MTAITDHFPDAEVILALEPEELGAKLLPILKVITQSSRLDMFQPGGEVMAAGGHAGYGGLQREVAQAFMEAFAWLEAQGLLIPADGSNGPAGWRRLSRRAKKFSSEQDLRSFAFVRRLAREFLHARFAERVWSALMRNEYDVAVFQAMKAVEVYVSELAPGITESA